MQAVGLALPGLKIDHALNEFELNWQIINTSLSRLTFCDRVATLTSFNSQAHLELLKAPAHITYR